MKVLRDYEEYLNIFENLDKIDHGLEKCNFFKLEQEGKKAR